ncbi:sensor histidine kinase [Oceanirhabdus sp. W0125-5]|uniref:sensor histidine kinase n=1 Tax=Oceanirhabdus sp. W0125-5 TaxID=2999116 RepID=UPI0022F30A55|nr:HAMP domain-containing sensor histidine kinase [Oceanirhabdus sp. W0125-5]WBW96596.1 HAMP domain-containing sensor histidine kinase [Oceanirhabdus sp. W0125-5]
MKNKIFYKLFGMTIVVILIILSVQFFFQFFLLEDFYKFSKEKLVTDTVESLTYELSKEEFTDEEIEKLINDFSVEHDIAVGISNLYGSLEYGMTGEYKESHLLVKDDQGQSYEIYLDGFIENEEFIDKLEKNINISVYGFSYEKNKNRIYPRYIEIDGIKFKYGIDDIENMDYDYDEIEDEDFLSYDYYEHSELITAKINEIYIFDNQFQGISYRNELLINEIVQKFKQGEGVKEIFESPEGIIYTKIDEKTKTGNMFFAKLFYFKDEQPMILFAASSLQSIREATTIINKFSVVILIAAIIITTMVSYIYSRKITKPLLHLNNITKGMSNLDFSDKCNVSTKDEIEELANNINNLSERLELALNDLRDSNAKLKEDIELKERMDEFRKRFIAYSSHELKTPLTVLKGIGEGLVSGVYNRGDDSNYENMLKEIDDMSQLVYDLLEISKLELGDIPLNLEIFQLSDIVLKVYDKLRPLSNKKNLEVELELIEDFIKADEEKIERVVSNLLTNAIQYTPSDGNIYVAIKNIDSNLEFSVENSPATIPDEDIDKIWEPFYRVEKSRNKALGGTGLGLHLVKEIVERHGFNYFIMNTSKGVKSGFAAEQSNLEEIFKE